MLEFHAFQKLYSLPNFEFEFGFLAKMAEFWNPKNLLFNFLIYIHIYIENFQKYKDFSIFSKILDFSQYLKNIDMLKVY